MSISIPSLMERDFSKYQYPLLIDGERLFLNKDPFVYAEEGVILHWPEKVEELACELSFQENECGITKPSSHESLIYKAARILAPHFLSDNNFMDYFKLDGGDFIREYGEYNPDTHLWTNQQNSFLYNKNLENPVNCAENIELSEEFV